jgi:hypothetical protein
VSYLTGYAREPALLDRLQALAALAPSPPRARSSRRFTTWASAGWPSGQPYPDAISAAGRTYWQAAGFDVVAYHRLDGVVARSGDDPPALPALRIGANDDGPATELGMVSLLDGGIEGVHVDVGDDSHAGPRRPSR